MLISQNIKNLISGISQQAPILRLPEQLEIQENGYSSEANGLVKRPPTVFIKALTSALSDNDVPLLHFVDRDSNFKYFVYFHKFQKSKNLFELYLNYFLPMFVLMIYDFLLNKEMMY